jgi:glutathione synthase/RimK-type ligase-like ATP-grasp enzyme
MADGKRVLIITQDVDPHADVMIPYLEDRRARPFRFHTQDVQSSLHLEIRPDVSSPGWRWRLEGPHGSITDVEVGSVWNRRTLFRRDPALSEQEAQFAEMETREVVLGLYRMTNAYWVNHPDLVRRAESKALQLQVAAELGMALPRTLLTNDAARARKFFDECAGEMIFKIQIQGRLGAEDSLGIYTSRVTRDQLSDDEAIRRVPCLFQELLGKESDIRVTIIGERIFAVEIRSQEDPAGIVDWRRGNISNMPHAEYKLPAQLEQQCLAMMRSFGLHYAAIDFVRTPDGRHYFLEINPSGQFSWVQGLTRLPLFETLADLLVAPMRRN